MTRGNETRNDGRLSVDFWIAAPSVAILIGWLPLIYFSGYLMTGRFPIGEILLTFPAMFLVLVIAVARFLATGGNPSRRASFIAFLLAFGACLLLSVAFTFNYNLTLYMAGVRARLQRDVDPAQLRQWALGMMPDAPQKKGSLVIRLPNGETIDGRSGSPMVSADEKGGYELYPAHFPTGLQMPFHEPVSIRGIYNSDPSRRYVEIGNFGRFGLTVVIGATNFVYRAEKLHAPEQKWADGIYIYTEGGG